MSKRKIIGITVLVILTIIVLGVIFFIIDKSRVEDPEIIMEVSKQNEGTNRLEDLLQDYSLEQAVQDGCVVITYKKIYNKDILDRFIQNTGINSQNRIGDKIRIVQYTVEGDTIITYVEHKIKDETYLLSGEPVNKTTYIVRKDNTRDKFAAESDRIITENDNIPGEIYGITTEENGDMVYVKLALYAEINYVDSSIKPYEDIEVCAYTKEAEIVNSPNFTDLF